MNHIFLTENIKTLEKRDPKYRNPQNVKRQMLKKLFQNLKSP